MACSGVNFTFTWLVYSEWGESASQTTALKGRITLHSRTIQPSPQNPDAWTTSFQEGIAFSWAGP